MARPLVAVPLLLASALLAPARPQAAPESYRVDPAASHVTISVGKAGLFSAVAGHTHEVTAPIDSGSVDLDRDAPAQSHVHLLVMSSALKVTGASEPPADRPKVQETMESEKVLDVARSPRIAFDSTGVTVKRRDGATLELVVSGQLTIRGVTQPVTAPVHVELTDSGLTANGTFSIKQSAFGIKPVSVAGVVSVKDALEIAFAVGARR